MTQTHKRNWLTAIFLTICMAAWLPLAGLFSVPILKELETNFLPVASGFRFELIEENVEGNLYKVYGKKERDCDFVAAQVLAYHKGIASRGQHNFVGLPDAESRPRGEQYFGEWLLSPRADSYSIETKHRCHPAWLTTTRLGEAHGTP